MLRSLILFSFILTIFLSSCSNGKPDTFCHLKDDNVYPAPPKEVTICTSEICDTYLSLWEELIQEENNFDQDFFNDHINTYYTTLKDFDRGLSFIVCYEYQVDWATANACDRFIININSDNENQLWLNLPQGQYLTKEDIKIAIDSRAFRSDLTLINPVSALKHKSFDEAMNALKLYSDTNILCLYGLSLDRNSGNIILKAGAQYECKENSCIDARSDLFTGEFETSDTYCYIIN